MRITALALAAALPLSACDGRPSKPGEPQAKAEPAAAEPRYVGRWAVSSAMCADGWWNFSEERIATAGETSCTVADRAESTDATVLTLACTAEGMDSNESWQIDYPAEGRMRVTRNDQPPVDLQRCES